MWRYGGYNGTIPIIGELDGAVILEFPQGINSDSSFHSISGLRAVTDIFERFEGYLKEHGEEKETPCRHPIYYLRKGIPNVSQ
jgi:hypothetical protein